MQLNQIKLYDKTSWLLHQRIIWNSRITKTIKMWVYSKLAIDLNGMSTTYYNGILKEQVCN